MKRTTKRTRRNASRSTTPTTEPRILDDGLTVENPGGQRGSVGAQQLHPGKGRQVRENVSGQQV